MICFIAKLYLIKSLSHLLVSQQSSQGGKKRFLQKTRSYGRDKEETGRDANIKMKYLT